MSLKNKVNSSLMRLFLSPRVKKLLGFWARIKRLITGTPSQVHFFYQPDDPYSHLLAQVLVDFSSRYDISLSFHIVGAPDDDVAPERAALEAYGLKDAIAIAPFYHLDFPKNARLPSEKTISLAYRAIAGHEHAGAFLVEVGKAVWNDDAAALEIMSLVSEKTAQERVAADTEFRNSKGHYLAGTLYYDGDWYWGVDRFPYLEQRLRAQKQLHAGSKQLVHFPKRPEFMTKPAKRRLTLEFYPSLRSPYTYLAMPEIMALGEEYPVEIVWRPVMPMVMRGLPVPPRKGRYIIQDAKREADRIGVPFGNVFDPVGKPVLRGYSLYPYAKSQGRDKEFLFAFCQLAWSEGVDVGQESGLAKVIERAGLDWNEAKAHLDQPGWEDDIEDNRLQLMASGLWGVPSFRLLGPRGKEVYAGWGRDRIWLLAHRIQEALSE
jgi:2-hydroxychromene-2-carboxylate isomerase